MGLEELQVVKFFETMKILSNFFIFQMVNMYFILLVQRSVHTKKSIFLQSHLLSHQRIFTYQNKKYIKVQRIHCTHS